MHDYVVGHFQDYSYCCFEHYSVTDSYYYIGNFSFREVADKECRVIRRDGGDEFCDEAISI